MVNQKKRIGLLFLSLFLSEPLLASHLQKENVELKLKPFATFTTSADWIKVNQVDKLSLLPPFANYYTDSSTWKNSASLSLALGLEQQFNPTLSGQLGLAGYFNTAVLSPGQLFQFADAQFYNFNYQYQIQSKRLMASTKLLTTVKQKFHPYLSAELGASFNRTSNYSENPLIPEATAISFFGDYNKTSFSWAAGLGLDMDINANLRLGLGYQFADLGKAYLNASSAQNTTQVLGLSHLYTNQLRFQLSTLI